MSDSIGHRNSADQHVWSYWERTRWPLQSLYFLLPLIVVYEVGIALWVGPVDIRARGLLRMVFEHLGVTGAYLPGLVVIVALAFQHLMERDPWRPEPKLYAGMWLESVALTVPLLAFVTILFLPPLRHTAQAWEWLASVAGNEVMPTGDWRAKLILPIGAGIYEELVFRLIGLTLLHLLLVDLLKLPDVYGRTVAVAITSVAFALYHFTGDNPFSGGRFAFYTLAGAYFAVIYLRRGFGIVVAVHALYNITIAAHTLWFEAAGA